MFVLSVRVSSSDLSSLFPSGERPHILLNSSGCKRIPLSSGCVLPGCGRGTSEFGENELVSNERGFDAQEIHVFSREGYNKAVSSCVVVRR